MTEKYQKLERFEITEVPTPEVMQCRRCKEVVNQKYDTCDGWAYLYKQGWICRKCSVDYFKKLDEAMNKATHDFLRELKKD